MLDNKIIDSQEYFTQEDSGIILPSDFRELLGLFGEDLLLLIYKINQLPLISKEVFNVVDLDDTIYSRKPSLQKSLLIENRGAAGNRVIKEKMGGYYDFSSKYIKGNQVTEFLDILKGSVSLILTVGSHDFQEAKLKTIGYGLEKANRLVLEKDYQKPLYLLLYVINNLGYIPGTINIYDDKVMFFNKYAPALSKLLKININVNQITLSEQTINEIGVVSHRSYSKLLVKD